MRITNNAPNSPPPAPKPLPQQPPAPQTEQPVDTPPAQPGDPTPPPAKDSFAYNATHCVASGLGLVAGFGAGATVGAFKGLVLKEYDHQLSPGAVRITRVATAGVGALFAANAGLALAGVPGALAGFVAGGLAGGIAGGAVVGLGEGLLSVAHGAVDTGLKYGNKGHQAGGYLVDKAFGK